jgi:SAM-dependent methyltransferase
VRPPATFSSPPWGTVSGDVALAGSAHYWEQRYRSGGHSGMGSLGALGAFKAHIVNTIVSEGNIEDAIEFGCGDGNQLALLKIQRYLGVDVSPTALALCRDRFAEVPGWRFLHETEYGGETATLTLSLDVVYHLIEDEVFERYMHRLFDASTRLVVIYSSDPDRDVASPSPHVRHRAVSAWVARHRSDATCIGVVANPYPHHKDPVNGSRSDFLLFRKQG